MCMYYHQTHPEDELSIVLYSYLWDCVGKYPQRRWIMCQTVHLSRVRFGTFWQHWLSFRHTTFDTTQNVSDKWDWRRRSAAVVWAIIIVMPMAMMMTMTTTMAMTIAMLIAMTITMKMMLMAIWGACSTEVGVTMVPLVNFSANCLI